jgi:hypothetical protein
MLKTKVILVLTLGIMTILALTTVVVAQEDAETNVIRNFEVQVTDIDRSDNTQGIMIDYRNLQEKDDPLLVEVRLPDGVNYVEYDSSNSPIKKEDELTWLFRLDENSKASLRVEVEIEDMNNKGEAIITRSLGTENTRNFSAVLPNKVSIKNLVDKNNNYLIDNKEILTAIEYWRTGETLGQGQEITSDDLLRLIEYWQKGLNFTPVVPASEPTSD